MEADHYLAQDYQHRCMEYVYGKCVGREEPGQPALPVEPFAEPGKEEEGDAYAGDLIPQTVHQALPVDAAPIGGKVSFEGSAQENASYPKNEAADDGHPSPIPACSDRELFQPIASVGQDACAEEKDVLGEITKLKVVEIGAVGPGYPYQEAGDRDKGNEYPDGSSSREFGF